MERIPDETLMELADGVLPPAEASRLEAQIAADPELRARYRPFVASRTVLEHAFQVTSPIPERILKTLREAPIGPARKPVRGEQPGFFARFASSIGEAFFPTGFQLAHVMALAAVFAGGGLLGARLASQDGGTAPGAFDLASAEGMLAGGVLKTALETMPSVAANTVTDANTVAPVLTFKSPDGQYCREYTMMSAAGKTFAGFACREPGSVWRVIFHAEVAQKSAPNDHQSAGGPAALDAAIEQFNAGRVESADEAKLLSSGWR